MAFRRRLLETPRLDLTPMIDVVFLLLIFFMITTTFVDRPGLTVDLPHSAARPIEQGTQDVQVYLTAAGEIYLDAEPVTLAALRQHLSNYGPRARHTMFLLMADRGARHGAVVQVMDTAKTAGFERLAIATDRPADRNTGANPNIQGGFDRE